MIVSVCYLLLFLFVGLLLARRAVPDADSAVLLPLGCGLGVSLLAVLPALFALPFGFTLPAAGAGGCRCSGAGRGAAAVRHTTARGREGPRLRGKPGPACCRWPP